MKLIKNTRYYRGVVYEWNLPTGSSCPFAKECRVSVDRMTGKFNITRGEYKCYAAAAERFPGVREYRWKNYEGTLKGEMPDMPKGCRAIRIHAAGDFYNQIYFDAWLEYARAYPNVEMWAYTKSIAYWVNRIDKIPDNLTLTASYGGRQDEMIAPHNLKNVMIYPSRMLVPTDRPIDTNDDYARMKGVNFALVDNYSK